MGEHQSKSIDQRVQEAFEFERDYGVFDFQIGGVYVWQYLRTSIVDRIAFADFFETHNEPSAARAAGIRPLINTVTHNANLSAHTADNLVFLSSRKRSVAGHNEDLFFYGIEKEVGSCYFIDSGTASWYSTDLPRRDVLDVSMAFLRATHYRNLRLTPAEKQRTLELQQAFEKQCGIQMDMVALFEKHIRTFYAYRDVYTKLFRKVKPKQLFFIVNYGNAPLTATAKEMGISVIEMQHAAFDSFHTGYAFPYTKELAYYPDSLWVWSEYFKNLSFLPLPKERITIYDNPFKLAEYEQFRGVSKIDNRVLIVSDGGVTGERLPQYVWDHWDQFRSMDVIYKLHPYDLFHRSVELFPSLKKISKEKNVTLVSDEIPIYQLLASSSCMLGVRSTVNYEALAFGCVVNVLKAPGWTAIKALEPYIHFIGENDEMKWERKSVPSEGYFIRALSPRTVKMPVKTSPLGIETPMLPIPTIQRGEPSPP